MDLRIGKLEVGRKRNRYAHKLIQLKLGETIANNLERRGLQLINYRINTVTILRNTIRLNPIIQGEGFNCKMA